ncbi:MAG: YicC family protein [Desulfobacterales bacterium]|nr:YicC family protein [Desulfobacterales bacterium]
MIKSMTAFGSSESVLEKVTVTVEIKSYNSKYLDLFFRLPQGYNFIEDKIKSIISNKVSRGKIEIKVSIKEGSSVVDIFEIDEAKAKSYHNSILKLKELFQTHEEISVTELILKYGNVIIPVEKKKDDETISNIIIDTLNRTLDNLDIMKTHEGNYIASDLIKRIESIEKAINEIKNNSTNLISLYQERLKDRIINLTKGIVEIDPVRIAQESAMLADKSDISEEIVRTNSHLSQFKTIMNSNELSGRKLNFLLQELNRELNTIGSKTIMADVAHIVVNAKSEIEKIREQVQNIE